MAQTLAELWISTGGHGVYEHLREAPVRPHRATPDPQALACPRAEHLLCGCLAYYGEYARQGASRTGLTVRHFTNGKARHMWAVADSDRDYRAFVMAEYDWAAEEMLGQWCERRARGQPANLYDAGAAEIAEALAGHVVRLALVREKLIEAEQILKGKDIARVPRSQVAV
jgi:hypothetical protein